MHDTTLTALDHEPSTREMAEGFKALYPDLDAGALEAHTMVVRTYSAFVNVLSPYLASYGLTPARFLVLRLLFLADNKRLSMGDLTGQLSVTSNAATKLVAGLERDGWLRRVTNPRDRRVIYTELLPEMEERIQDVMWRTFTFIGEFWQPFTDEEKNVVISVMARLKSRVLSFGATPSGAPDWLGSS